MSIRIRIARWLAPEWAEQERLQRSIAAALRSDTCMANLRGKLAKDALHEIIARSTPGANSTVKSMVKIAEKALG